MALEYARQHHPDCDIVRYAGMQLDAHYFWMKNSRAARYTGLGRAIAISTSGSISEIKDGNEINEIRKQAVALKNEQK